MIPEQKVFGCASVCIDRAVPILAPTATAAQQMTMASTPTAAATTATTATPPSPPPATLLGTLKRGLLGEAGPDSVHGQFIHGTLLPLLNKLQRELRGRKHKVRTTPRHAFRMLRLSVPYHTDSYISHC
jgi:hypothetical protein